MWRTAEASARGGRTPQRTDRPRPATVEIRPFERVDPSVDACLASIESAAGPVIVIVESMRAAGTYDEAREILTAALHDANTATVVTSRLPP